MKHDSARKILTARLVELLPQIGKIEAHLSNPLDKDSQERSTELENDEVLGALDAVGRAELVEIRAALERLGDGTYGICAECNESISTKRLEALPTASLCIHCAKTRADA